MRSFNFAHAVLLFVTLLAGAARATESTILTEAIGAPIDVRELGLVKTAMVGAVRFDIGDNTVVGTMSDEIACYRPRPYTLAQYESAFRDRQQKISGWGFSRFSVAHVFGEKMKERGYPVYAPEYSVFAVLPRTAADLRVALTIIDMHFDKCGSGTLEFVDGSSQIKAKWEVFSESRQETVYGKIVQSSFNVSSRERIVDIEFNKRMVAHMIDILQADPEFVALFKPSGP